MSQTKFWKNKSKLQIKAKPNYFAIKSYNLIKNKKYSTLLDLGCGRSGDSLFYAKKGYNITAFDVSKNRILALDDEVKRLGIHNIKLVVGDISKLNFPNDSFDVIYAHLSLHYFNHVITEKVFKKLYKYTKKDGAFFVKVKSTNDFKFGKGKKIGKNMYDYNGHIRHFFDKEYLQYLLGDWKEVTFRHTSSFYLDHGQKSKYIEVYAVK